MRKKRRFIIIVAFLEVLLVLHASWLWKYGISQYGMSAGMRVIGDVFLMILLLVIASMVLDRLGPYWVKKEIDERAGEVTSLTRQFKKQDREWRWEGNTLTREMKKSLKQDLRDMKAYCIHYRHFRLTNQMIDAMKWAYRLGYYRASLEVEEMKQEQVVQQKQLEEDMVQQAIEESKIYQRQMEKQYKEELERIQSKQEKEATVFIPEPIMEVQPETDEDKVIRYLKLGYTGKEIAEELGFSPAKVSRIRKRALQEGWIEE